MLSPKNVSCQRTAAITVQACILLHWLSYLCRTFTLVVQSWCCVRDIICKIWLVLKWDVSFIMLRQSCPVTLPVNSVEHSQPQSIAYIRKTLLLFIQHSWFTVVDFHVGRPWSRSSFKARRDKVVTWKADVYVELGHLLFTTRERKCEKRMLLLIASYGGCDSVGFTCFNLQS